MINIDNPCQLFVVIDWMMRLPKALEQELWSDIETLEEIDKMRYVTSVERITQASSPQLEQWLDNILDAPSIEAIFTETDSN